MLLRWFRSLVARRPQTARRRPTYRPAVEGLEGRTLLTAGALDPTFGSFGKTVVAFDKGPAFNDQARAVAVDSFGRTVVAGFAQFGATDHDFAVMRLNPDGSLDTTFGNGGRRTIAFDLGGGHDDRATSVAIDSFGRIVVAGYAEGSPFAGQKQLQFAVARLNPNGFLDGNFGTGGKKTFEILPGAVGSDVANAVAIDAAGGVLLAGSSEFNPGDTTFAVVRLLDGGSIDTTFGIDGHNFISFSSSGKHLDSANAMAIDAQGRIILAGIADKGGGDFDFGLVRLSANGQGDLTFGDGGRKTIAFNFGGSLQDVANDVALDAQGRIVVAGSAQFSATDHDFAVARLTADGQLDVTFDGDGKRTVAFDLGGGNEDRATSVMVQKDGKILMAGSAHRALSTDIDFALARLNADGSLYSSFDGDGKQTVVFDLGGGKEDKAFGAALTPDGSRVVVVGSIQRNSPGDFDFGVARLDTGLPSGAPLARDLSLTKKIQAGELATLTGRLEDADAGDTLFLTVDWGDGSAVEQSTPDRAPFQVTHLYKDAGTYTVRVTWTDSTGLSNSQDLTIMVKPAKKAGHNVPSFGEAPMPSL